MPNDPGVAIQAIFDLEFLPYYPASQEFEDHSNQCVQCHAGAFHRDQFPPDVADEDLFCETGLPLMEVVRTVIIQQHHASLLN